MAAGAGYPVPARPHRVEESVRRSRFVTTLARAGTDDAARRFVEAVRAELPDATHHCWAYVAGPPGDTARVGMSDDGEPHGTAGRPMLHALLHSGVGEVVAVCARYYGGVKLGTGGLSRAYSGGVSLALADLPTEQRVERRTVRVRVTYRDVDALRRLASERSVVIEDEDFGTDVLLRCSVPIDGLADFEGALADATSGRGRVEAI